MEATNRERWKSVNGYANYEISNCGRVRNATTERILKNHTTKNGYLDIGLPKNGSSKRLLVHRLVAEAFFENPAEKRCVDHIDGNRSNNNVDNLRWANTSENARNACKTSKPTSSIYKGVDYNKQADAWRARIRTTGKQILLGYFANEREAGMAYNTAAILHHTNFAKINIFSD